MRVGHPCSLERQSFVVHESTASRDSTKQRALHSGRADFESISPVLLHAPKISKPPGSTSAKSMLFVVFLSARGQERRSGIGVKWRTIRILAAVAQW